MRSGIKIEIKKTHKKIGQIFGAIFEGSWVGAKIALVTIVIIGFGLFGAYINTGINLIINIFIFALIGAIIIFLGSIILKCIALVLRKFHLKLLSTLLAVLIIFTLVLTLLFRVPIFISIFLSIVAISIEALLGAAIWIWLKSREKRFLAGTIVIALLAINMLGIYNLKSAGESNKDLEKYLPVLSAKVSNNVFKNPGVEGNYQVKTIFYGSGTDKRREEYGENANIKTYSVSAYTFLENYRGLMGKLRTTYWGFDDKYMPINGRVWYPEGDGKFPLVLIVHGNHAMEEYSDGGYEYLGRLLASQGFIAASIDENFLNASWFGDLGGENDARAWILLKHLDAWKGFNNDEKNPFYNKVDLENIALIGHSRGGEAVATAALFNKLKYYPLDADKKFNFNYNIKSVVAIAPSDEQYKPADKPTYLENVNYLLLQGANDGDISFFMGSNQYERVKFNDGKYYFKTSLYIYGANHGQFNTVWGREDLPKPLSYILNLEPLLSEEDQRNIAKTYIAGFLRSTLKDEKEYIELFKDYTIAKETLPKTVYVSRFEDSSFKLINNYEEDAALETTTLKGGVLKGELLDVWKEGNLNFRSDYERVNNGVYLKWKSNGGSYSIVLPNTIGKEWSIKKDSSLVFSACDIDENKIKNEKLELTDFSIRVKDSNGEKASISLSSIAAIPPAIGVKLSKWDYLNKYVYGKDYEPVLQTYKISMMDFMKNNTKFNPEKLNNIEFIFDKSKTGEIVIDDIGMET